MHVPHLGPARLGVAGASALALALLAPLGALGQPPTDAPAASAMPGDAGSLDGDWVVDPTLGAFDYDSDVFTGSWVGHRVQEELVGVGGVEAVGRTPDVTGSITLSGSTLTAADLVADLRTLRSDQSMRDGQLGRQGIETDRFPTATFVLTEPIALGTLPAEGETVQVKAVGDLTIYGVTRNVTIPLYAVRQGDVIGTAGSLTFTWDDFGMEQPQSMRVVSLANDVTLELQVFFRHQASADGAGAGSTPAA
jgi:polyisoprenoid-binding protein YceI